MSGTVCGWRAVGGTRVFFGALAAAFFCLLVLAGCSDHDYPLEELDDDGGNGEDYTFEVGGVKFDMVYVKGGTFTMAVECEFAVYTNECPAHQVTLSSYYITKYEVTQEQWVAVMGSNPSYFRSSVKLPVEGISYIDIPPFMSALNNKTGGWLGKQYRLPSEAEWEFAAKGGTKSLGYTIAGAPDDRVDEVMWHRFNSNNETHPVGQKLPNELGIHDMTGNVWEWVNDWYSGYKKEPVTNPVGPSIGEYRIYRGFGFKNGRTVRITRRVYAAPEISFNDVGFRIVISSPPIELIEEARREQ